MSRNHNDFTDAEWLQYEPAPDDHMLAWPVALIFLLGIALTGTMAFITSIEWIAGK
jgi:hypothetical protein